MLAYAFLIQALVGPDFYCVSLQEDDVGLYLARDDFDPEAQGVR